MKCDGCTACCLLLEIPELNKKAGELCKHCDSGKGCNRHNDLPRSCANFLCAYAQMEKAHIDMRPDKCGVLLERITDTLFLGTIDPEIGVQPQMKGQLFSLLKEGFSVILLNNRDKSSVIYPRPGQTKKEVWEEFQEEVKKRHGNS